MISKLTKQMVPVQRVVGGSGGWDVSPGEVVVVGALPPPVGGVSVFVRRQVRALDARDDVQVLHVRPTNVARLIRLCVTRRKAELHVNSLHPVVLLIIKVTGSAARTVIYDHNRSRHMRGRAILSWLTLQLLKNIRQIYVAGNKRAYADFYRDMASEKICSFVPFMPPDESNYQRLFSNLPEKVQCLARDKNVRLVVNSAWKIQKERSGSLVYGFGPTARIAHKLLATHPDVHFLFFLGQDSQEPYARDIVAQIETTGNSTLVIGNYAMWPIFRHARVFLRTTATDGDSIAVREALHFKVPVLASDVVPRPVGVTLYRYGSDDDLYEKLVSLLTSVDTN